MTELQDQRPFCWNCRRAQVTCICKELRPFETRTQFVLLVHPREARNRVGTARIVERSIQNSLYFEGTGAQLDQNPRFRELLTSEQVQLGMLFPGKESVSLQQWKGLGGGEGVKRALVLIDGTWPQAKKMIRESALLKTLPKVGLTPTRPSQYRIRMQPAPGCLSTLEAIVEVMQSLGEEGPQTKVNCEHLLRIFGVMVDHQIDYQKRLHIRSKNTR